LGLLGGVMWSTGVLASLAAAGAPAPVQINAKVSYALAQGAPVLGALWGLLAWREFKGSTNRSKAMAAVTLLLMLAGIGVASSTR
jgi:glucose uptake protein